MGLYKTTRIWLHVRVRAFCVGIGILDLLDFFLPSLEGTMKAMWHNRDSLYMFHIKTRSGLPYLDPLADKDVYFQFNRAWTRARSLFSRMKTPGSQKSEKANIIRSSRHRKVPYGDTDVPSSVAIYCLVICPVQSNSHHQRQYLCTHPETVPQ